MQTTCKKKAKYEKIGTNFFQDYIQKLPIHLRLFVLDFHDIDDTGRADSHTKIIHTFSCNFENETKTIQKHDISTINGHFQLDGKTFKLKPSKWIKFLYGYFSGFGQRKPFLIRRSINLEFIIDKNTELQSNLLKKNEIFYVNLKEYIPKGTKRLKISTKTLEIGEYLMKLRDMADGISKERKKFNFSIKFNFSDCPKYIEVLEIGKNIDLNENVSGLWDYIKESNIKTLRICNKNIPKEMFACLNGVRNFDLSFEVDIESEEVDKNDFGVNCIESVQCFSYSMREKDENIMGVAFFFPNLTALKLSLKLKHFSNSLGKEIAQNLIHLKSLDIRFSEIKMGDAEDTDFLFFHNLFWNTKLNENLKNFKFEFLKEFLDNHKWFFNSSVKELTIFSHHNIRKGFIKRIFDCFGGIEAFTYTSLRGFCMRSGTAFSTHNNNAFSNVFNNAFGLNVDNSDFINELLLNNIPTKLKKLTINEPNLKLPNDFFCKKWENLNTLFISLSNVGEILKSDGGITELPNLQNLYIFGSFSLDDCSVLSKCKNLRELSGEFDSSMLWYFANHPDLKNLKTISSHTDIFNNFLVYPYERNLKHGYRLIDPLKRMNEDMKNIEYYTKEEMNSDEFGDFFLTSCIEIFGLLPPYRKNFDWREYFVERITRLRFRQRICCDDDDDMDEKMRTEILESIEQKIKKELLDKNKNLSDAEKDALLNSFFIFYELFFYGFKVTVQLYSITGNGGCTWFHHEFDYSNLKKKKNMVVMHYPHISNFFEVNVYGNFRIDYGQEEFCVIGRDGVEYNNAPITYYKQLEKRIFGENDLGIRKFSDFEWFKFLYYVIGCDERIKYGDDTTSPNKWMFKIAKLKYKFDEIDEEMLKGVECDPFKEFEMKRISSSADQKS